jgi:hypothetical protein
MTSRIFTIGVLFLLVGGWTLAGRFIVQDRLARVPRMTCDQLARDGPPGDGQVTLTDARSCSRGVVAARVDHSLDLYVPAYPAGSAREPEPPDLAFLFQIWSDDEQDRLLEQPGPVEATCWVHRGAQVVRLCRGPGEIEEWARDGLQEQYPGIRLANVWVLTVGHGATPTAEQARSALGYGIGELLIGGALLGWGTVLARRRFGDPSALRASSCHRP